RSVMSGSRPFDKRRALVYSASDTTGVRDVDFPISAKIPILSIDKAGTHNYLIVGATKPGTKRLVGRDGTALGQASRPGTWHRLAFPFNMIALTRGSYTLSQPAVTSSVLGAQSHRQGKAGP